MGVVWLALGLAGMYMARVKAQPLLLAYCAFLVPYWIVICSVQNNMYYARYLLPLIAPLCIFAAFGATSLLRHWQITKQRRPAAQYVIIGLLTVPLMYLGTQAALKFGPENTRMLALNWVEKNAPAHSKVLSNGFAESRSEYLIPVVASNQSLQRTLDLLDQTFPAKAQYLRAQQRVLHETDRPQYHMTFVYHFQEWPDFSSFLAENYDFVFLNLSRIPSTELGEMSSAASTRTVFANAIAASDLYQEVFAVDKADERWGPSVRVYQRLK